MSNIDRQDVINQDNDNGSRSGLLGKKYASVEHVKYAHFIMNMELKHVGTGALPEIMRITIPLRRKYITSTVSGPTDNHEEVQIKFARDYEEESLHQDLFSSVWEMKHYL